ncbi:condensation domain-containing protein [Nocardia sp. CDC159]|uniref:Condensation domain-containing protein n=1 Tax=Nocardia pulmonis TaxID=2951408 RepID=A0A9X2IWR6_9NOCA|nr:MULTISPECIES: condensation domain-containing protein [Nocardia]MCM6775222.1 condensation domain-containing protein [Nocardia pulmonis]MCM6788044.1 condensation domain-containing protein [Nocardia sp. CDC159]
MRTGGLDESLRVTARPIVVRPTAAARAAAATAAISPAPPGFLQLDHLRAAVADPAHPPYLGVVTHIPGLLDSTALVDAITAFVRTHDGLRTWFEPIEDGFARHVVDPAAIEFEAAELDGTAEGEQWTAELQRYFEAAASPLAWPPAAFAAAPAGDGFDLVFVADHALSDGMSQALAALELTERYRATVEDRETRWRAPVGGNADYAADEHGRAADALADELFGQWDRALAETGYRLPVSVLDLGTEPGERYRRQIRTFTLLDGEQARSFDAVLNDSGASLSAALFGALALTDYELTGRDRYWTLNVLGTRFGERFATGQGWYCNFVPVSFALPATPDLAGVLPAVRAGLERARRMSRLPVHGAIARVLRAGRGAELVTREPSFVTILDLRQAAALQAPDADTRIFTADGTTSTLSIWLGRNATEYFVSIGAPDVPVAWERLTGYAERLRATLVEIATTGNYRPGRALTRGVGV